jgi:hypothetical protein
MSCRNNNVEWIETVLVAKLKPPMQLSCTFSSHEVPLVELADDDVTAKTALYFWPLLC